MSIGRKDVIKVCLVGNTTVGKSCIAERIVEDNFNEETKSTIGSAYFKKTFILNGETVHVNLWDTAGQERFRALAPLYYRDASAIVLVYDISSEESFHSLWTVWVPAIRACTRSDLGLAVVGNKADLEESGGRAVATETGRAHAELLEAVFLETSAKTGDNVANILPELILKMRETRATTDRQQSEEGERRSKVIRLPQFTADRGPTDPAQAPNGRGVAKDGRPARKRRSTCTCN